MKILVQLVGQYCPKSDFLSGIMRSVVIAGLALSTVFQLPSYGGPQASTPPSEYALPYSGISLPTSVGIYRFTDAMESNAAQRSASAVWHDTKTRSTIACAVSVSASPQGTRGPSLKLDAKGKPIVARASDNPYAVFELVEPSKSFSNEWNRIVKEVRSVGLAVRNTGGHPIRIKAQPQTDESPIGYQLIAQSDAVDFAGDGKTIIAACQSIYLFHWKGYFCEVRFNYFAGLEKTFGFEEPTVINSIRWPGIACGRGAP